MTHKKLMSLILVLALLFAFAAPATAATTQAQAGAERLYEYGLFLGKSANADGTPNFDLDADINRAEAITLFIRLLGKESEALSGTYSTPFTDIPGWAEPYIGYAYENGLSNGVSATSFGSADAVSPTQFLTFLLRALGYVSGVDFEWNNAIELTDKIDFTSDGKLTGARFGAKLSRGDVVIICDRAISTAKLKNSDVTLRENIEKNLGRKLGAQSATDVAASANSGLTVYFIDVGQADSALILCDGAAMLIDGGNVADSDLIYTFLEQRNITYLDYIVATHAHEDHVGGLAAALNFADVGTALCPVTQYDSAAFGNFAKYLGERGKEITVPSHGDTFTLGGADIQILGPVRDSKEPNNTSIVLKLTYGSTSFLFTGDAERDEEADILAAGYDLSATVLKVGHHGSATSTTYPFLREIMPQYAVISCGAGNSYGHPHDDTLSKLRDADLTLYRTDLQGTITAVSDGKTVTFTTERNADAQTNPTEPVPQYDYYIGNVNSKVLHSPSCNTMPAQHNQVRFETLEEALDAGYSAHRQCIR